MVGIILIGHFTAAQALKETVAMIIGERENLTYLSLSKQDKMEDFTVKLKKLVEETDKGDGVLIIADMFGGTPSNAALMLFGKDDRVRIMTGFNLPLVIEAVMHSSKQIDELVKMLMEKRDKTIVDAKALFNKRM
jgi:PTS system mannose-specific IIA component